MSGNLSFFLRLRLCLRRPGSHVRFLALALMLASLRRTCEPAFSLRGHDFSTHLSYTTLCMVCIKVLSQPNFALISIKERESVTHEWKSTSTRKKKIITRTDWER